MIYSQSGLQLFEIDSYTKILKPLNTGFNKKNIFFNSFKKIYKGMTLKFFLNQFNESEKIEKLFKDAFIGVILKKDKESFSFNSSLKHTSNKKNTFDFVVNIFLSEENFNFIVEFKWKIKEKIKEKIKIEKSKFKKITIKKIIENNKKFKGFICFNLNDFQQELSNEILNYFIHIPKKDIEYLYIKNKLLLFFYNNSEKKLLSDIMMFSSQLNNNLDKIRFNWFFQGSSFFIGKIKTINSFYNATKMLDFYVSVSIRTKKNFISCNTFDFDKEEYQSYIENINIFNSFIKNNLIKEKNIFIKNFYTKRTFINYTFPVIKEIKNLKQIITNLNNKKELINSYSRSCSSSYKISKLTLLDVYSGWLIKNKNILKNKNIIYIIYIQESMDYFELTKVIDSLTKKGFMFGVRFMSCKNISIFTIIQQLKSKFIIIDDSSYEHIKKSKLLIYLSNIKNSIDDDVEIIYENPPKWINKKIAKEVGMKFYYIKD